MRKLFAFLLITITMMTAWAVLVFFGRSQGWLRKPLAPPNNAEAFVEAMKHEISSAPHGNVALAIIEDGKLQHEYYTSIGEPVDANSLFQIASVSKWVTALGVMNLVEDGLLDLDTPVSAYLTRWQLPSSEFDNQQVTVRRLLSHTAGLTDDLSYGGFPPETEIQTLEESLTLAADRMPGVSGITQVGSEPGEFQYSGGGYTLLQLIVEEVTQLSFDAYMKEALFEPLGMLQSTFILNETNAKNLVTSYASDGSPADYHQYTALAAASLYTTVADMSKLIEMHFPSPSGELPGRGVLRPQTLESMRKPHGSILGRDHWGLGSALYVSTASRDFVFGHNGGNWPAINTVAHLNPDSNDGLVILGTGNPSLANKLGSEWIFWQTGEVDLEGLLDPSAWWPPIRMGWLIILLCSTLIGVRSYKNNR